MGGYKVLNGKIVIGLQEKVSIKHSSGNKNVIAKIDTGATKSSIDTNLAAELKLGPVIKSKLVKSAHGSKLRPIIEATIWFLAVSTALLSPSDIIHLTPP